MLFEGDIVTGTPENEYGITTRGAILKVIWVDDDADDAEDGVFIRVEVLGFDYDLLSESRSALVRRVDVNLQEYIGNTYQVNAFEFERYEEDTNIPDLSDELVNFVDSM